MISFFDFTVRAFQEFHNEPYQHNWHIKYICDTIEKRLDGEGKNLLFNTPPRSMRSFIFSVCLPVYAWIKNPKLNIATVDRVANNSYRMSLLLTHSNWFRSNFNNNIFAEKSSSMCITNKAGGTLKNIQPGNSTLGLYFDLIICDNMQMISDSKKETEMSLEWYKYNLQTKLAPSNNPFIVVSQERINPKDLTGYLLKFQPEKWNHVCIPAEIGTTLKPMSLSAYYKGGLFFLHRFNENVLMDFKKLLGYDNYNSLCNQEMSGWPEETIKLNND